MIASKAWFLCLVELAVEIRLGGFFVAGFVLCSDCIYGKLIKFIVKQIWKNIGGLEFLRGANAEGGGLVGKADSMFVEERRALIAEFLADDFSKVTF